MRVLSRHSCFLEKYSKIKPYLSTFSRSWQGTFRGLIKKPAKKLFRVLCGFFSGLRKDSLQLNFIQFYTVLCFMSRNIANSNLRVIPRGCENAHLRNPKFLKLVLRFHKLQHFLCARMYHAQKLLSFCIEMV
jgi:hypothetical protein